MSIFENFPTALFGGKRCPVAFKWHDFGFRAGAPIIVSPPIALRGKTLTIEEVGCLAIFEEEMRKSQLMFPERVIIFEHSRRRVTRDRVDSWWDLGRGKQILSRGYAKVQGTRALMTFMALQECGDNHCTISLYLSSSKLAIGTTLWGIFLLCTSLFILPQLMSQDFGAVWFLVGLTLLPTLLNGYMGIAQGKREDMEASEPQLRTIASQAFSQVLSAAQSGQTLRPDTVGHEMEPSLDRRFEVE